MAAPRCPNCGIDTESGRLSINVSALWNVGFRPDTTPRPTGIGRVFPPAEAYRQREIRAFVCPRCGHLELVLDPGGRATPDP
jgi:predicted RNA-binding Zn-ribbon protein involved in translation (DUF1610 family)